MKIKVISQFHPAAVLHQPRLWSTMLDDWQNLPKSIDSDYVVVPSQTTYSCPVSLDTENAFDGSLGQWSVAYRDELGNLCVAPFYGHKTVRMSNIVVMHNAKWDARVLSANKLLVPEKIVCTMIAAYCLGLGKQDVTSDNEGLVGGLGLKYLARRHLGMAMKTWQEVKDKPDLVPEYNAADSVATYLLWEQWKDKLPQHFWSIDMPLLGVIMTMEDRGIAIDPNRLRQFSEYLDKTLDEMKVPLNPYSVVQLRDYIYKELKIEPFKFTESGAPSVDEEVLRSIDDPVVQQVLKYKELHQEKGTYVDNYIKRMTPDCRIHPEFKQVSTATGRLSSARPNLQNVPKEGDMRRLFVAPSGKLLVRVDWSQIELRMFAALTQDLVMLEAFETGRDIHQETADITGLPRSQAKNLNFLMLYGGGAWKASHEFGLTIDQAKDCIERYHQKFPAIKEYMDRTIEEVHETKTITNWSGRVRRLDALYAEDWRIRKEGEREAINTPIQGGAAEVVKLAMIDLHQKHSAPMLVQVHDELLFEVDENAAVDYAHWLKEYLPTLTEVNGVRFPVNVSMGKSWKECMENE